MATIEVSTWAELVNAITSASSGDTIKLIADIDCNRTIPEGVTSTIVVGYGNITIDGGYTEGDVIKRHEIRNLRTNINSPVTIFKFPMGGYNTVTHTVKNIDFVNSILDKPLLGIMDYYTADHNFYVKNCRFTGKRTDYLIGRIAGQSASEAQGYVNVYLQNSYFNVPYYGSTESKIALCEYYKQSSAYFYSYADNCRIRTHYTGTYTPAYNTGNVYSEVYNISLTGCRVEGDIVANAGDVTYINFYIKGSAPSRTIPMQNVYDVDFYITSSVSNRNVDVVACKGLVKKPIKVLNSTTTYTNYNEKTDLIFATESEMQDTDWLIQHNFDVVPSNQGGE